MSDVNSIGTFEWNAAATDRLSETVASNYRKSNLLLSFHSWVLYRWYRNKYHRHKWHGSQDPLQRSLVSYCICSNRLRNISVLQSSSLQLEIATSCVKQKQFILARVLNWLIRYAVLYGWFDKLFSSSFFCFFPLGFLFTRNRIKPFDEWNNECCQRISKLYGRSTLWNWIDTN